MTRRFYFTKSSHKQVLTSSLSPCKNLTNLKFSGILVQVYVMGSASGVVIKDREIIGHFRYFGVSDVVIPKIWPSFEELDKNWNNDTWNECSCGAMAEDVILYTSYGDGFYWSAKACLRCGVIVTNLMPTDDSEIKVVRGPPKGITIKEEEIIC